MSWRAAVFTLVTGWSALISAPLAAQTPAPDILQSEAANAARDAALQMLGAIEGLAGARSARDQVAALTATIQAHEAGLSTLRAGLRQAVLREAAISRQFDSQSDALTRLLAAMMAVERVEGPALLAHPAGPLATARAGMLMADLAPSMQAEANRIGALLGEYRELRNLRENAEATLSMGLVSLEEARAELSQSIAERRTPPPPIGENEARLLELLESASTLETLAASLASLPPGTEIAPASFEAARGQLPLPVLAAPLRGFNEPDAAGTRRPGLVLAAEPGALVTAPWDGTLRYRGPLVDYGNVIVLEPAEAYLLLIAGLETVYPQRGAVISAGEPLGLLAGTAAAAAMAGQEFIESPASAGSRSGTVYLELRHRGQPIDPSAWFDLSGANRTRAASGD